MRTTITTRQFVFVTVVLAAALAIPICYLITRTGDRATLGRESIDVLASIHHPEMGDLHALALSRDGTLLAAAGSISAGNPIHTIRVWDWRAGQERASFRVDTEVNTLDFSPDGLRLASGVSYRTWVRFSDTASWREQDPMGTGVAIQKLAYSPDGKTLAVAGSGFKSMAFLDLASQPPRATLVGQTSNVEDFSFAPDGKHLVSFDDRGPIHLWGMPAGKCVLTIPLPPAPKGVGGHGLKAIAFAPDSQSFATADADGVVRIWEVGRWEEKCSFPEQTMQTLSIAYSADGSTLAVGCGTHIMAPGVVQFWDIASGKKKASVPAPKGLVRFLRFVPGQPFLVVGTEPGWECSIEVWDVSRILGE